MERAPAQALDEKALLPSEPVTVVLSRKGWVRAAKKDIDPASLSYRSGDGFLAAAAGRSNQQAVFLDSLGRSYALPAGSLPSARSHGEPLTGRLSPPGGGQFIAVVLGGPEEAYILASDAGYGFVCKLDELISRNKSGKAVLTLPQGAAVLPPVRVTDPQGDRLVAITDSGRLLTFPVGELPVLNKGKGNKIIDLKTGETLAHLAAVPQGQGLTILAGKRKLGLRAGDLEAYRGERGRRGRELPRGLQRVDRLVVGED